MNQFNQPVIILCGGLGTRLATIVENCPKILVEIKNVPFLEYLLMYLRSQGAKNIYLALGYMAENVIAYLADSKAKFEKLGVNITCFIENQPLGTAGALSFALNKFDQLPEQLIVMNGDTFIDANLYQLLKKNKQGQGLTMVVVNVEDVSRYGSLLLQDELVTGFVEKGVEQNDGVVNGGIYCFDRKILELLADSNFRSLEDEVFPILAREKSIGILKHHGVFLDYGTPDGLLNAEQKIDELVAAMVITKGSVQ